MWAGGMVVKVNVEDGRRWRCAGEAEGMVVEVNVEAGGWLRCVSEAEGIGYGKVGEIHTYQVIGNCSDVLLTLSLCAHPHAHIEDLQQPLGLNFARERQHIWCVNRQCM